MWNELTCKCKTSFPANTEGASLRMRNEFRLFIKWIPCQHPFCKHTIFFCIGFFKHKQRFCPFLSNKVIGAFFFLSPTFRIWVRLLNFIRCTSSCSRNLKKTKLKNLPNTLHPPNPCFKCMYVCKIYLTSVKKRNNYKI